MENLFSACWWSRSQELSITMSSAKKETVYLTFPNGNNGLATAAHINTINKYCGKKVIKLMNL